MKKYADQHTIKLPARDINSMAAWAGAASTGRRINMTRRNEHENTRQKYSDRPNYSKNEPG